MAAILVGLGCWWSAALSLQAQWVTQTIPLQAGWNAVHIRVHPAPASCEAVFTNLPVTTVSRYNARVVSAQFATDPNQLWKRPDEWLTWARDDGASGQLRTLQDVVGGATYLIRTTNDCVLRLKGRPVIPRLNWVPGRANLVGFQVSPYPEQRPTFADFFRYEPAIDADPHPDARLIVAVGPQLESINLTAQTTRRVIDPNAAYWIHAQKLTDFTGLLRVTTSDPAGLIYGTGVDELSLQLRHLGEAGAPALTVTLRHVPSESPPPGQPPLSGPVPLLYADRTGTEWTWRTWPTDQSQSWTLIAGQALELRLAVNRTVLSAPADPLSLWQSLLNVSSSSGTFVQVPISVGYATGNDQPAPFPYGLWVGDAEISEVSCARYDPATQTETSTAPLPAGGTFPVRLILHAARDGHYRLLSRAVVASVPGAGGGDTRRIYSSEAGVPSGATVLSRLGSAAFGHASPVGLDGPGFLNALQGSYVIDYDDPLNPFKHLYHPGHDNRDASGALMPEGVESFTISNRVAFSWNSLPDPSRSGTALNPTEIATGTYVHEITHLRRAPITMRGAFTLRRISRVDRFE